MTLIKSIAMGLKLPRWAHYTGEELGIPTIIVYYPEAYPYFMKLLGVGQLDRYWYEVIRRCLTTAIKDAVKRPVKIILDSQGQKEKWRMANFPDSSKYGADSARLGAEKFRPHYSKIKKQIK